MKLLLVILILLFLLVMAIVIIAFIWVAWVEKQTTELAIKVREDLAIYYKYTQPELELARSRMAITNKSILMLQKAGGLRLVER